MHGAVRREHGGRRRKRERAHAYLTYLLLVAAKAFDMDFPISTLSASML